MTIWAQSIDCALSSIGRENWYAQNGLLFPWLRSCLPCLRIFIPGQKHPVTRCPFVPSFNCSDSIRHTPGTAAASVIRFGFVGRLSRIPLVFVVSVFLSGSGKNPGRNNKNCVHTCPRVFLGRKVRFRIRWAYSSGRYPIPCAYLSGRSNPGRSGG